VRRSRLKSVQLITDGACKGNPGRGGWACILRFGKLKRELFGSSPYTTNNRMELAGAIEGLRRLKEPCTVEIITDSEYLRNGITSWIKGWKKNGWKTAAKKPVTNKDLWLMLDQLVSTHKVEWTWTKGHASHEDNNRCDELASEAAVKQLNSEPDSQNDLYRKHDSE
jgi:ribonuclease HI